MHYKIGLSPSWSDFCQEDSYDNVCITSRRNLFFLASTVPRSPKCGVINQIGMQDFSNEEKDDFIKIPSFLNGWNILYGHF